MAELPNHQPNYKVEFHNLEESARMEAISIIAQNRDLIFSLFNRRPSIMVDFETPPPGQLPWKIRAVKCWTYEGSLKEVWITHN